MEELYNCPVCGWRGLEEDPRVPYGTHEICSCCGVQIGYEIMNENDVAYEREHWLQRGAPWAYEEEEPADWSLERAEEQIREYLKKTHGDEV